MGSISCVPMPDERFIGRGENLIKQLLTNPFDVLEIKSQVPISHLISSEDFGFFDEEIQKHKFDLVIWRKNNKPTIAVEVNYHHGEKADRKSNNIFEPVLEKNGVKLWRIDDYECHSLFKQNGKGMHKKTTADIRDILNSFDLARLKI